MRTRDQQYASKAFEQINELVLDAKADPRKYGTMAHKLPVLIRTSGLAQAIGFVECRGNESQRLLLAHISDVIGVPLCPLCREAELAEYMRLTKNVLAALVWYKRFSESVLNVRADIDTEGVGD